MSVRYRTAAAVSYNITSYDMMRKVYCTVVILCYIKYIQYIYDITLWPDEPFIDRSVRRKRDNGGEMWYVGRRSEETSDIDVASQLAHLLTLGESGGRWRSRSEQSAFSCGPGWTRCAVAEICESAQAGLTVPGYVLAGPGCPQSAVHGADASAE